MAKRQPTIQAPATILAHQAMTATLDKLSPAELSNFFLWFFGWDRAEMINHIINHLENKNDTTELDECLQRAKDQKII